jgi:putative zinc finger protein
VKTGDDRDRAIEALLKRGAAEPRGSAAAHLAPDMLAAYVDEALTAVERSETERHLAGCADCQAILRVIVETEPEPVAPARRWGALKWLVPLMAAATAVVVWVAVPQRSVQPTSVAPLEIQIASTTSALPEPSRPLGQSSPSLSGARAADAERAAQALRDESERALAKSFDARGQTANTRRDAASRETRARNEVDALGARAAAKPAAPSTTSAPAASAPVPTPAAAPMAAAVPPVTTSAPAAAPVAGAASPAAPGAAGAAPAQVTAGGAPAPARKAAETAAVGSLQEAVQLRRGVSLEQIASPDGSVVLRFLPGVATQRVERSTDRGTTWTPQTLGVEVILTSGACPSRDVCWVVGRGGAVLLSTDAKTWRRIAFPVVADLVGIVAESALSATVTTADGRRFQTRDSGQTWAE